MSKSPIKSFRAVLEPLAGNLGWVIARLPFDAAKAWPVRRGLRVRGEIEGFAFRSSLFTFSGGEGQFLLVNKRMQKAAKASVGTQVQIRLEPDLEERVAVIPPELAQALKGDRRLRKWFDDLSPYFRRTIGAMVGEAKTPAIREKRAEQMAERLLLTMEGETELPPILHAAFLRQPLARTGWNAMTPTQRRGHLLGIFGYQSMESRERRTAQAVEEALRVARKANRTLEE
jgi:uncharacterized protein YdeI (YjbR/CyaY-like superfamily)